MQKFEQDASLSCRCSVFLAIRAEKRAREEQTSISTIIRKALVQYLRLPEAEAA